MAVRNRNEASGVFAPVTMTVSAVINPPGLIRVLCGVKTYLDPIAV